MNMSVILFCLCLCWLDLFLWMCVCVCVCVCEHFFPLMSYSVTHNTLIRLNPNTVITSKCVWLNVCAQTSCFRSVFKFLKTQQEVSNFPVLTLPSAKSLHLWKNRKIHSQPWLSVWDTQAGTDILVDSSSGGYSTWNSIKQHFWWNYP